jgi:putative ABC transport system permease protein
MSALNRKLLRDLWHLRGQVVSVALVVACGIATYVTMRSAYEALVRSQGSYYESYGFADLFAQLKRAPEPLARQITETPGVAAVETRIVAEVTLEVPGLAEPATGRLVSVPEGRPPRLNGLHLRRGRTIEPGRPEEVVASEAFCRANGLEVGGRLGAVLRGRWQRLHIVGIAISPEYVYEMRGLDVFPDNKRFGVLWMGRKALASAFDLDGAFNDLALALAPGGSEPEVIARLDLLLERYGGLGAHGRSEQLSHRFLSDEIAQDRVSGLFIPAIFLGTAAFLLHVVLARLVYTQRAEIAVLKAFGYESGAIGLHYLKFALAAVLPGTVLGTALGVRLGAGLAEIYTQFFHFPVLRFEVGPRLVGLAAAISAGAACLGALTAVRAAVSLPPAEAMRPEGPARFRPGLLDRSGLGRLVPPSARLIVRNLERRGWKSLLSGLGIALAVSILIVGFYAFDAVDYMMKLQFEIVQREDMSVLLSQPRGPAARHALGRLPGVLRVEAFRSVPVRLRSGARSRRVGLLGLTPRGELRRLVDARLRPVELPAEGLVLSGKLAQILGVARGELLPVEVLEGSRRVREVPVSRLVDELIGLSAYMDERALGRLMGEGETISGAHLAVDPRVSAHLYSKVKRTPAVGGVTIPEAMLAGFRDTIAESLRISTVTLVLFACVIAASIVYNGARIALSERGHELACLRILGFTRREISGLLLGEQAFLTLLAIPTGFVLGYGLCALVVHAVDTELYRMPLFVSGRTYAFAFLVIAAAALVSGLLIVRRIARLDLVAVLKSRE